MIDKIADCDVLIAGGMGHGAFAILEERNVMPLITEIEDIDEAVKCTLMAACSTGRSCCTMLAVSQVLLRDIVPGLYDRIFHRLGHISGDQIRDFLRLCG
jgi:hypothetical protein